MSVVTPAQAAEPAADREGTAFFESKIRPVLVARCYECHSDAAGSAEGGLRLDTRGGTRAGGDSGPAVVPGDPAASRLLAAVRYDGLEMPPDGRLPAEVVADFEAWVRRGAPDPRDGDAPPPATGIDFEAAREFWSFRPPRRHAPPADGRAGGRIDAFVLARLGEAGLTPNPEADRRTLIRRVTFDLTGLPPTPDEVEAFVGDERPLAYERLVDRLLASPRYGERRARLWLDLARYAEDQAHIVGDDKSLTYPNAHRYRDWVVRAFNGDLPYDRFVTLQLAADLVEPADESQLAALGFLGLGPKYYRRNAPEVMADEWEDRVDVATRGLLGLSVACARCHDHKFEPVSTEDYYALAGVFASTEMFNRPLDPAREAGKDGQAKKPEDALHVVRDGTPRDLNVFLRGDVGAKGPVVRRRFPAVLCPEGPRPFGSGSGRRELAEAVVAPDNPLTARVIVNRVWGALFGRPLVGTPSDFGRRGDPPTHPELLDDLAARFVEGGWSLKRLDREIVLSAAYRRSSAGGNREPGDPENRLLWRANRRRLDVEQWRDAVLAASDRLTETVGGPSIEPDDPEATRRTVYARVSRFDLNPMLSLFDFPDPNAHSARRAETVTPLQKLFLMNGPFALRQADALAARLLGGPDPDDAARVRTAYRLLYGRDPTADEARIAAAYLAGPGSDRADRWTRYAQALFASNELLTLD